MVKPVNGASLPPTKNFSAKPDCSHATAFKIECNAVEQVMEWEISGPLLFKSCATQDEILPKVVVGDAQVAVFPVSKNSLWYFSNNWVAPREEPIFIPKVVSEFQLPFFTAFLDVNIAIKTL